MVSPHVLVFANMPPTSNALSADRVILLEILNKSFNYIIRRVKCSTIIDSYNGKFVKYHYISERATKEEIMKMNRLEEFQFSDEELQFELQENSNSILGSDNRHITSYVGESKPVYRNENSVPQYVIALLMANEYVYPIPRRSFNL